VGPGPVSPCLARRRARVALRAAVWLALGWLFASGQPALAQSREVPDRSFFFNYNQIVIGEFDDAGSGFQQGLQGNVIKAGANRWVDSIAFYAMLGESYYQKGRYREALDQHRAALNLYLGFSDWLVSVRFNQIQPAQAGQIRVPPWGRSTRGAKLANYPPTYSVLQGKLNATNNAIAQGGGIVQEPIYYPVVVDEIVKATALAIRRRRELLGPTGAYDPLNQELIRALSGAVTPANHWSRCWADVHLGLAYAAAGKDAQAKNFFLKGLVAAGEYDHCLTPTALFELGRIELQQGNFDPAQQLFLEASYSAFQFNDVLILEESLRYAQLTHILANRPGPMTPLLPALVWSRTQQMNFLQTSLGIQLAESLALKGDMKGANNAMVEAKRGIGRSRSLALSTTGARFNFMAATYNYLNGAMPAGDGFLEQALSFQRSGGSLWLYHISLAESLALGGAVADRDAFDILGALLRDPTPADWLSSPIESLSVLSVPHSSTYEHWFEIARRRKEVEASLEIADLTRRHRFFSTLPLGGRLLALRWILEAPDAALTKSAVLQKQDLLAQFPNFANLSKQAQQIQTDLAALPPLPQEPELLANQEKLFKSLAGIQATQELMLRQMAVRRIAAEMVFPPKRRVEDLKKECPKGTAAIIYFATPRQYYGFLISNTEYSTWDVATHEQLYPKVAKLLREMGHLDKNRALNAPTLLDREWRKSASDLTDLLAKGTQSLPPDLQELVIVPDGVLWYVPFELLGTTDKGAGIDSWITKTRLRYAPTAGLVLPDQRPRGRNQTTAVAVGQIFPRDSFDVAEAAYQELAGAVPGTTKLSRQNPLPAPTSLYATLFDRVVTYDEIPPPEGNPHHWMPIPVTKDPVGSSLETWLALPWKGPDQVFLPGYHTAAENSLKGISPQLAGSDVFLPVCGLMSTGARTVLLSRWRTGGQNGFNLVKEFVQELPHTTPADAWQRSILVNIENELQPDREPRIELSNTATPPKAEHPFFWSGYLLIDTGTPLVDAPPAAAQNP